MKFFYIYTFSLFFCPLKFIYIAIYMILYGATLDPPPSGGGLRPPHTPPWGPTDPLDLT